MKIPFFDYPQHYLENRKEYIDILDNVLSKGSFIMQDELIDFEDQLAKFCNCKYSVGVADGTAAIKLSLQINKIGYGDEVIISTHTFIATASAINSVGAIPIACDIGLDGLIDDTKIEELITKKTKAIMPTQLNGLCANMSNLKKICKKYELCIIEDSCQGLGVFRDETHAGLFGKAGSLSFFPAKTLGCFGDGGAILTNDFDTYQKLKILRNHGREENGYVNSWGINGRLDNIQAAILIQKINGIKKTIEKRRMLAELYIHNLQELASNQISFPFSSHLEDYKPTFQNFEIICNHRDLLRTYLNEENIGTLIQWGGKMIHHHGIHIKNNAKYADEYSNKMLMLPLNHYLKKEHIIHICDKIKEFYNKYIS